MSLAGAPWLTDPRTERLLDALGAGPGETRFVGGVVRDALLDREVADIDLATTLAPEETQRRVEQAGLIAKPTGVAHGTITAIVDGRPFEVTTLRQDVETHGRHATVAFTDDWRADAARRDFTINAMSAGRDGALYDYFGGEADLAAGRVRFVGDAAARVREDYLRILRFFRFHAWYGKGAPDADGLAACAAGTDGLGHVSAERLRVELLRLLAAPDPGPTLAAMDDAGVLHAVLGAPAHNVACIATLPADPVLRLAALAAGASGLATRLRLSNQESQRLQALAPPWTDLGADARAWRRDIHRLGADVFNDRARLAALAGEGDLLAPRLETCAGWPAPTFPLKGRDLIALDLAPGPAVARLLRQLEADWAAGDFQDDRATLLAAAERSIRAEKDI